jgi:FeS assembly SUF system regulator
MLRLSKLTDYGIVVMTYLAQDPLRVVAANDVAAATRLALPTVSKVLKLLSRGRLLLSVRGAHGGYRLARPPRAISIADVIHALEGPLAMTECSTAQGACVQEPHCAVRANWQRINDSIHGALAQVSLEDMVMPRVPAPVVPVTELGLRRQGTA